MKTLLNFKSAKMLAICLTVLLVAGCSPQQDGRSWSVKERCVKGVTYYEGGYKLAVAFNRDSKVIHCGT